MYIAMLTISSLCLKDRQCKKQENEEKSPGGKKTRFSVLDEKAERGPLRPYTQYTEGLSNTLGGL